MLSSFLNPKRSLKRTPSVLNWCAFYSTAFTCLLRLYLSCVPIVCAGCLLQDLRASLHQALDLTGAQNRELWKPFWAAQQRFFKLLCISMKVRPTK